MTLLFLLQEEQRSSRSWMVDHSSDDIAVWRPSGGTHHLCPPPSLHHIDPALCDQPECSEDRDCAVEGTGRQRQGVPALGTYPCVQISNRCTDPFFPCFHASCQFTNTYVIISLIGAVFISEQANVIIIDTSLFACTVLMLCIRYFLPYNIMVADAQVTVTNIKIQKVK
jgi:hypothetical protein